MRYLERLKQRATNINVLTQNKSSYLLAHVVLEEDLLDLGGDHVGVQAAGQGRHLIQTRGRCQEIQMKLRTSIINLHWPPDVGGKPGGRSSIIFLCEARGSRRPGPGCERLGSDPNLRPVGSSGASNWGRTSESGSLARLGRVGGSPAAGNMTVREREQRTGSIVKLWSVSPLCNQIIF